MLHVLMLNYHSNDDAMGYCAIVIDRQTNASFIRSDSERYTNNGVEFTHVSNMDEWPPSTISTKSITATYHI
jgi:hypothetical protein